MQLNSQLGVSLDDFRGNSCRISKSGGRVVLTDGNRNRFGVYIHHLQSQRFSHQILLWARHLHRGTRDEFIRWAWNRCSRPPRAFGM